LFSYEHAGLIEFWQWAASWAILVWTSTCDVSYNCDNGSLPWSSSSSHWYWYLQHLTGSPVAIDWWYFLPQWVVEAVYWNFVHSMWLYNVV